MQSRNNMRMNRKPVNRQIFKQFFDEFKHGLGFQNQEVFVSLIDELLKISGEIPSKHKHYSFREILMMLALINERKLKEILS